MKDPYEPRVFPCIGCGYCCRKGPCALSTWTSGSWRGCPDLRWDGKKWRCAHMLVPGKAGEEARNTLAAGEGCSSPLFNDDRVKIPTPEELQK